MHPFALPWGSLGRCRAWWTDWSGSSTRGGPSSSNRGEVVPRFADTVQLPQAALLGSRPPRRSSLGFARERGAHSYLAKGEGTFSIALASLANASPFTPYCLPIVFDA